MNNSNILSDDGEWTEESFVFLLNLLLLLLWFCQTDKNLSLNFRVRIDLFMEPTVIFSGSDLRLI